MTLRMALAAVLGVVPLLAQPTIPRTLADADRLEEQIRARPDDVTGRVMLLRFYSNQTANAPADRVKAAYRDHLVWLVEHHPDNVALRETWAAIVREGRRTADAAVFDAVDAAWRKQLGGKAVPAAVSANAIPFYKLADPAFARKIAGDGLRAYPKDADIGSALGMLYAVTILQAKAEDNYGRVTVFDDSPAAAQQAQEAREALDQSKNAAVLGGAGSKLQQQLYSLEQARRTSPVPDIAALAERCLQRAAELEPANGLWKSNLSMLYMFQGGHAPDKTAALRWHEKAAAVADANNKISALQTLAAAQLDAGDYTKAAESARELLSFAASRTGSWDYGNAIHRGNIVLGRVALHQGDNAEAARRLLAAGGTKGSPQLNSFGPDWVLAR